MASTSLDRARRLTEEIGRSTARAVEEIFQAVDRAQAALEEVSGQGGLGETTRQSLGEIHHQFTAILSALQFQDLTCQQLEALSALLDEWGEANPEKAGATPSGIRTGAFDPNAAFDRGRSDLILQEVDRLLAAQAAGQNNGAPKRGGTRPCG